MSAILASWPNSYKRLVPGYEAPVYLAWAHKNRSPLIRVPNFGGRKGAARCEIRCPDGSGNPYLQFAVLLATGLDGIKNKIDPGDPVELNVYHMSYEERKSRNIVSLPESLKEALDEMETSDLMRETLGETAFENFLTRKTERMGPLPHASHRVGSQQVHQTTLKQQKSLFSEATTPFLFLILKLLG